MGKLKLVDSGNNLSTFDIVDRIISNSMQFRLRNSNKEKREIAIIKTLNKMKNENKEIQNQNNSY